MSTVQQIALLQAQVANLQAMIQGVRYQGLFYAMIGSNVVFGCKVTAGFSTTDMILALDGQLDHINPDGASLPVRVEQNWNVANIYGEVFLRDQVNTVTLQDANLTVSTAPGTGYHRYDAVYAYQSSSGPACGIVAGVAVVTTSTPALPPVPHGTLLLAQVHVQANVTGLDNTTITDMRNLSARYTSLISYTVATLPVGKAGQQAYVTDASAPTFLGALTGGGAVVCPVFFNGVAWVAG